MFDDQARRFPLSNRLRRLAYLAGYGLLAAAATVDGPVTALAQQPVPAEDLPGVAPAITPDEATTRAALLLLNDAVTVQIDGRHHTLLRALRHLEDRKLTPLFNGLSTPNRHPALRIHGWLGAAELSASSMLDVEAIAQVRRRDLQAELIGAALDGDLLDEEALDTLLGWAGLDPAVKLLLATPRVAAGAFDDQSPGHAALLAALDSPAPGQRGLAGLLLHEMGDPRGTAVLDAFTRQAGSTTETVTAMLLETAWTHGLRRCGDWALAVAEHDGTAARVEMLALKVAVRFGQAGADRAWSDRVARAEAAGDVSRRARLALAGLEVAPWLDAERFETLIADEDALIAKLGRAGQEVAAFRQDASGADAVEAAVAKLLESGHPRVWGWAAGYAEETGSSALGRILIQRYEPGDPRGRSRRLEAVVNAVQVVLADTDSTTARFFVEALSAPNADESWQRAVLLGLIRDGSGIALRIAEQLPEFIDRDTAALVLVLRTQSATPLSDDDRQTLEQLIQGGVELDDSLRVQTAWAYLDRTGQGPGAITALLAPGPPTADGTRRP